MGRSSVRLALVALVGGALAVTAAGVQASPVAAAPVSGSAAVTAAGDPVRPVKSLPKPRAAARRDRAADSTPPRRAVLPAAGDSAVSVPVTGMTRAGASPVWVGSLAGPTGRAAAGPANVQVLDQASVKRLGGEFAGVRVTAAAGTRSARVRLDYTGFAVGMGGNYAGRLVLFVVPACAQSTPDLPGCRPRPLPTVRNAAAGTVEAVAPLVPGSVPIAQAGPALVAASARGVVAAAAARLPAGGDALRAGASNPPSSATTAAAAVAPGSVSVGAVTVLAAAVASGDAGSYTATPLEHTGSWSAGGESGSFSYSYPMRVAPSPAGDGPKLSLSYDSGSVDGRTSADNGQVSWVGQGWDIGMSFIERSYRSCSEESDAVSKGMDTWGDLCWSGKAQYTLSMNGSSHDLIPTGGALSAEFRLRDDPGWRVKHLENGSNGDQGDPGDKNEYWVVTTPDGTDYTFGIGVTPWSTPGSTNSVWTVPVFGDDTGEPCNAATLAASWCQQAWRWNLDRIVDARGNNQAYTYTTESNHYARNGGASTGTLYDRGGYLASVQYGGRIPGGYTSAVIFQTVERCLGEVNYPFSGTGGTCPAISVANASAYPDVPVNLLCGDASCSTTAQVSPSFFETVRLHTISMQTRVSGTLTELDRYEFRTSLPDPDGTGPDTADLWLREVRHIGSANGGSITLPRMTAESVGTTEPLPNRVDIAGGHSPLAKFRVDRITSETGDVVDVTYGHASAGQTCTQATITGPPALDPASNTLECYPRWFKPTGAISGQTAWFHKYVVLKVVESDPTIGAVLNPLPAGAKLQTEPRVTTYQYSGPGAWHFDDNPVAPSDHQTWSQWRGYGTVTVFHRLVSDGIDTGTFRDRTKTVYFRGMNWDKSNAAGTPRVANIVTVEDPTPYPDYPYLRGKVIETSQLDPTTGNELTRDWFSFWALKTIAVAGTSGTDYITPRDAYHVETDQIRHRITKGGVPGAIKTKKVINLLNPEPAVGTNPGNPLNIRVGMVDNMIDYGDESTSTDDRCSTTDYTWNFTNWMVKVSQEKVYTGNVCAPPPATNLISRADHWYDGQTATTFGDDGTLTQGAHRALLQFTATGVPITTKTFYDVYGRVTSVIDGRGKSTSTAYTPATGALPTTVTVTTPPTTAVPAGLVTSTDLDIRGSPVKITGPNDTATSFTSVSYDALGRVVSVKKPAQQNTTTNSAVFTYTNAGANPTLVKTSTLQSGGATPVFVDSYTYFDGYGRPVQTQTTAPSGTGRVLTVNRYGDRGLVAGQSGPNFNSLAAGSGWVNVDRDALASETRYSYDTLGRKLADITLAIPTGGSTAVEQWRTSTAYDGLDSRVSPPTGGDVQYLADARGRTTTIKEYNAPANTGTLYATTALAYDAADRLTQVTSPLNKVTTYGYDFLGRRTTSTDPDTGTTTSTFDDNGNLVTTVDARGATGTVSTNYDNLNRPTIRYTGAVDNAVTPTSAKTLASWTYDTATLGLGQVASATARANNASYTQTVTGYDVNARPLGTTWSIPAGFGIPAAVSYHEDYGYDDANHLTTLSLPNIGGLAVDTVTATWTPQGLPSTLVSSAGGTLVAATGFDTLGRLTSRRWKTVTGPQRTYGYDGLNRVTGITTTTTAAGTAQNDTYTYTGPNLTRILDGTTAASGQQECFTYDDQRRLKTAYTTTNANCGAANTTGPLPYNQAWTFDTDNSIKTFTDSVGAVSSTYTIGGTGQPAHATTAVTGTGATTRTYDPSGYLLTSTAGTQTLTWDATHQLVTDVKGGVTTNYVYAADGTRLIRQAGTETTLTLGGTDIIYNAGVAKARRYYTLAGAEVAVRDSTSGTVVKTWLAGNTQGSTTVAIDAATEAVTRTKYTPYGTPRTAAPGTLGTGLAATDHGWLGATLDKAAGLNHLGARYYDSGVFTFTAPDPIATPTDPRATNPYTYTHGNPITYTDPTGLDNDNRGTCADNPGGGCTGSETTNPNKCTGSCGSRRDSVKSTSPYIDRGSNNDNDAADPGNHKAKAEDARKKFEAAAKQVLTTIADITGLKSIYDCATSPSASSCFEAAFNIILTFTPESIFKYGWTAIRRFGEVTGLLKVGRQALDAFRTFRTEEGLAEAAQAQSNIVSVTISRSKYPESAAHIEDAQAAGHPSVLTVDRAGAAARRKEAMRGNPTVPGKDRDEYPLAMTREGGSGSSVRPIGRGDNRGSGACVGQQCRGLPDGTEIEVTIAP